MPRPGEDDLDWLIRRALQQSVAGAEPPSDLWWDIRHGLSGGPGPRHRGTSSPPLKTGSLFLAAALRLSTAISRVWPAPLSAEQTTLLEQRWTASFVLLGFAPLGRVY
jgi:hypothetical protein